MIMNNKFRFGVICSLEKLPDNYPITLRGDIEDVAERARLAGAEALELHIRDPYKYYDLNRGIAISAITTGLEYVLNKLSLIDDTERAVARLKEHIDLAEKIGCPGIVIGVVRGNIPDFEKYDEYEALLTEAVTELADYAAKRHVDIYIEAINRYVTNWLCSVPEVLSYVKKLDRENIKVHIDTHQMNIEDVDFYETIKACGDKLGYVHFSDNNRGCPGEGNIDFLPVIKALKEIGYSGYIVIESTECPPGCDTLEKSIRMLRGLGSA